MAGAGTPPRQRVIPRLRAVRVFFALWPDEIVRSALDLHAGHLRRSCGGRATRRENLHLTLVFVGDIEVARLDELRSVAGAIAAAPFELVLDQFEYWRRNRIVCASPLSVPGPLRELVAQLEGGLGRAGIEFDQRPYVPHVTLLRDARASAMVPMPGLAWPVGDFVLVQSASGARGPEYRVLARWALRAERQ